MVGQFGQSTTGGVEVTTFWGRLAAGQAIVGTDTESAIFYWNAAAEAIYGWTADEAIGRQAVALF